MTHLYLVRHGEAYTNVEPIVGGMRGDRGLTPLGVQQAERLRDRLDTTREIQADVLIASTLPRARQTAEIIAPALGLPITWDDDVQEMRPGDADGLTLDEFRTRFGPPDFRKEPFRPLAPNGESWTSFVTRVGMTLDRLLRQHEGQTAVIVCHGGFIDATFLYFFGLSTLSVPNLEFFTHNTSLTYWERRARPGGVYRWRLGYYNDVAHLRDVAFEEPKMWEDLTQPAEVGADAPSVPLPTEEGKQ